MSPKPATIVACQATTASSCRRPTPSDFKIAKSRRRRLIDTAGLNQQVFDSLVVLAAGSWEPAAIETGFVRVQQLQAEMDEGRRRRLTRLGFSANDAEELARLHTRNFM